MEGGTTFYFVTGGIHEALERARDAANGMDVRIGGGPGTIQQYLRAGLIDELHVAIRSVLNGKTYLSPDVAGKVIHGYLGTGRESEPYDDQDDHGFDQSEPGARSPGVGDSGMHVSRNRNIRTRLRRIPNCMPALGISFM